VRRLASHSKRNGFQAAWERSSGAQLSITTSQSRSTSAIRTEMRWSSTPTRTDADSRVRSTVLHTLCDGSPASRTSDVVEAVGAMHMDSILGFGDEHAV